MRLGDLSNLQQSRQRRKDVLFETDWEKELKRIIGIAD